MKDPAFLFYVNDFDSGTKFFSHHQLGLYIRLLMAQHQHGRLTEKQVRFIGWDDEVMAKFKTIDNLYYNERLESEILKRRKYSDSRKSNRIGKKKGENHMSKHISNHVSAHMENENENENKKLVLPKSGFMAGKEHLSITLTDVQIGAVTEYIGITKRKSVDKQFILKLWQIFKIKEFTGKKWYNDEGAVFTHFLNSLKYEKIEDMKVELPKPSDKKSNDILKLTD